MWRFPDYSAALTGDLKGTGDRPSPTKWLQDESAAGGPPTNWRPSKRRLDVFPRSLGARGVRPRERCRRFSSTTIRRRSFAVAELFHDSTVCRTCAKAPPSSFGASLALPHHPAGGLRVARRGLYPGDAAQDRAGAPACRQAVLSTVDLLSGCRPSRAGRKARAGSRPRACSTRGIVHPRRSMSAAIPLCRSCSGFERRAACRFSLQIAGKLFDEATVPWRAGPCLRKSDAVARQASRHCNRGSSAFRQGHEPAHEWHDCSPTGVNVGWLMEYSPVCRVIDCASWIAGRRRQTILSDFGGPGVIKIEPPGGR